MGDLIVVQPSQMVSNVDYNMLRTTAINVAGAYLADTTVSRHLPGFMLDPN